MSDNSGERRSFRGGGSTPRSGRDDNQDRRREENRSGRTDDRRQAPRNDRRSDDRRQGPSSGDRRQGAGERGGYSRSGEGRPSYRGDDARQSGDRRRDDRGDRRQGGTGDNRQGRGGDRPNRYGEDRRGGYGDRPRDRSEHARGERPQNSRGERGRDDRRGGFGERPRGERPEHGRGERPRDDRRGGDGRDRGPRDDRPRDDRASRDSRGGGPDRREGGAPRRRGGEGGFGPARGREGVPSQRRDSRPDEPDLPDDVEASELDPTIRRDLLSLDKSNANTVARHLVMAGKLIDDEPRLALAHARAARQRAGRIAVVREAAGITAYHAGEWAEALSELRAARRMSGGPGLLAVMADCERGLGRPERAIELGRSEEARALTGDEASELRIVVAGARMDLGQFDQAVVTLQTPDLDESRTGTAAARLFYAYADALVAAGRTKDGVKWFLNAAAADLDGDTDAEERVAELTGEDL
ncbi:hypothetical protein [Rhodococcus phenolicus]|uniref:tetratricopeptide repeat protein n=1 Tax=Rhodococcus phenolicus TaxID=263849 RepID=UPI0009EE8768